MGYQHLYWDVVKRQTHDGVTICMFNHPAEDDKFFIVSELPQGRRNKEIACACLDGCIVCDKNGIKVNAADVLTYKKALRNVLHQARVCKSKNIPMPKRQGAQPRP